MADLENPNLNLQFTCNVNLVNNGYILAVRTPNGIQNYVAVNNEELAELILGCLPPAWSGKLEESKNGTTDPNQLNLDPKDD